MSLFRDKGNELGNELGNVSNNDINVYYDYPSSGPVAQSPRQPMMYQPNPSTPYSLRRRDNVPTPSPINLYSPSRYTPIPRQRILTNKKQITIEKCILEKLEKKEIYKQVTNIKKDIEELYNLINEKTNEERDLQKLLVDETEIIRDECIEELNREDILKAQGIMNTPKTPKTRPSPQTPRTPQTSQKKKTSHRKRTSQRGKTSQTPKRKRSSNTNISSKKKQQHMEKEELQNNNLNNNSNLYLGNNFNFSPGMFTPPKPTN